jgi:hypothetical protein
LTFIEWDCPHFSLRTLEPQEERKSAEGKAMGADASGGRTTLASLTAELRENPYIDTLGDAAATFSAAVGTQAASTGAVADSAGSNRQKKIANLEIDLIKLKTQRKEATRGYREVKDRDPFASNMPESDFAYMENILTTASALNTKIKQIEQEIETLRREEIKDKAWRSTDKATQAIKEVAERKKTLQMFEEQKEHLIAEGLGDEIPIAARKANNAKRRAERHIKKATDAYTQLFQAYYVHCMGRTVAFTPGVFSTGFAKVAETMGVITKLLSDEDMRRLEKKTQEQIDGILEEHEASTLCILQEELAGFPKSARANIERNEDILVIDRNAISQQIGVYLREIGIRQIGIADLSDDVIEAAEETRRLAEVAIEVGL